MLQTHIQEQAKEALRARHITRLSTLRGLLAAFTNELVAKGRKPGEVISDEDALTVIKRSIKQRRDSIEQFTAGNRPDLAAKEEAELAILTEFLPAQLSREEIEKVARAKIAECGITDKDKSKTGILIGAIMKELKGQADGAEVKAVVDMLLQ